ncbi:MAG: RhuM family protein, partial [Gillisia sp.]
ELQALNRKPMYIKDWVTRLDDFLTTTGNEILDHKGIVSHEQALAKGHKEYDRFKEKTNDQLSMVEKDFIKQIEQTQQQLKNKQ